MRPHRALGAVGDAAELAVSPLGLLADEIAVVAATALFFTGPVPTRQPGANAAATHGSRTTTEADT